MRDIVLVLIVAALIPVALKRPAVGALMFAWMSIMNPHKLTYGFAHDFPFALLLAGVTMVGFVLSRDGRKPFPKSGLTAVYILMIVWMSITTLDAMGDPAWVRDRWSFVMKIHIMILITMMLIRGRQDIERLVWVVAGSVAFYGIKGGAFTLVTGGGSRVWGPPGGMIEENNALAVATVMMVPLIYYLRSVCTKRWLRIALAGSLLLMAFAILGSQSRGALLALLAMATLLGLKSRHPVRSTLGIAVLMVVAIAFMPDSWTTRMDTITTYTGDSSAMSRVYTWMTLWNLGLDRPFLGAGFGTDTLNVFKRYAPTEAPFDVFTGSVWVAHSIYFQALGEHGFVGLFLFLMLGFLTWRMSARLIRDTRKDPEYRDWVPLLMGMCQTSLIGYAAGAAFLTLMHLDVAYYIMAIVVVTHCTVREARNTKQAKPSPLAQAPSRQAADGVRLNPRAAGRS